MEIDSYIIAADAKNPTIAECSMEHSVANFDCADLLLGDFKLHGFFLPLLLPNDSWLTTRPSEPLGSWLNLRLGGLDHRDACFCWLVIERNRRGALTLALWGSHGISVSRLE